MKSAHTPTPWFISSTEDGGLSIVSATPIPLAYMPSAPYIEKDLANAALIVKAVNEREEILQTVRSAMTILERDRDAMQGWHILAGLLAKAEAE